MFKKYIFLALFICLSHSVLCQNSNNFSSEILLGKEFFEAFKTKNYNRLSSLILSYKEYIDYEIPIIKSDTTKHIPEVLLKESENLYQSNEILTLNKLQFEDIIQKGKNNGIIEWNNIIFKDFVFRKNKEGNLSEGELYFDFNNIKFVIGGIILTQINKYYKLVMFRDLYRLK